MQLLALRVWQGVAQDPVFLTRCISGGKWAASQAILNITCLNCAPSPLAHHLSPEAQGTRTRSPLPFVAVQVPGGQPLSGAVGLLILKGPCKRLEKPCLLLWLCRLSSLAPPARHWESEVEAARHLLRPSLKFCPCPRIFG